MLDIVMWPVDRPKDYPLNARKWSKKAVEKVRASLRTYGFRQPVVVDREETIIIGHLRRQAAREEGMREMPVHIAADLTPAQVRGLRLMDNRSHDEAMWDEDLLRLELVGLKDFDLDLGLTGFDIGEIDKFTLSPHGTTFEHVREGRRLEAEDAIKEEFIMQADAESARLKGNRPSPAAKGRKPALHA